MHALGPFKRAGLYHPTPKHRLPSTVQEAHMRQTCTHATMICLHPKRVECCDVTCPAALWSQVKARVMAATDWPDNAATHLATAMITGVVSTTATNPVDVIKTFMFVGECSCWCEKR